MTSLGTLTTSGRANQTVIQPRIYLSNDRDAHQCWDAVWSTLRPAGIAAPTAQIGAPATSNTGGNMSDGTYLVRYRYRDSTSPQGRYRSDPSPARSVTLSGGTSTQFMTFDVGASGTDIIRSTDPKVDTIVVERTLAGGSEYFVLPGAEGSVPNAGVTSASVSTSDTDVSQSDLSAGFGGDFGHEPPPLSAVLTMVRGFCFASVAYAHRVTVDLTNGSATVTANGDSFADGWVSRLFLRDGDAKSYRVNAVTQGSPDTLTLGENYAGSTGTAVSGTIYSSSPNRVYWSAQYYPESFKAEERASDVLRDTDDVLVGAAEFLGDPWFFGRSTVQRLVFATDPASSEIVTVSGQSGLWNQRCIVRADRDALYWFGQNGVWAIVGGQPRLISRPIDADWRALLNYSYLNDIHGAYDADDRTVSWWFVPNGGTTPTRALVLDLDGGRWRIDQYRQGIAASATLIDGTGRLRVMVADSVNDRLFTVEGATDGVPAADTNQGKYTANTGSTTTVTNTVQSLPTGAGTDLSGLIAYAPSLDEARAISANTSNTITHAAFSSALAAGAQVLVGSIPVVLEEAWWVADQQGLDKRPQHLQVLFQPSTVELKAQVRIYRDFQASPTTWAKNASRTVPKGMTWTAGAAYAELDLSTADGVVLVPLPGTFAKALKVKITINDPAGTVRILDWAFVSGEAAGSQGE